MLSPRKLLEEIDRKPRKKLGQHFLVHEHAVRKILQFAAVEKTDTVLEIGPGLGALTLPLAVEATKIYAVEIDPDLVKVLKTRVIPPELRHKVEIIETDVLKLDIKKLVSRSGDRLKVLGNLPYNISTPVLFKLLDNADVLSQAMVMLQTEVAERLIAKPGTKNYGILTVLFGYRTKVTKGFTLKPEEFYPPPKVGSMVISINFDTKPAEDLTADEEKLFVRVVKTTFGQRRKMLRKSLLGLGREIKDILPQVFERSYIEPDARPETLTVEDFCRLTKELRKIMK